MTKRKPADFGISPDMAALMLGVTRSKLAYWRRMGTGPAWVKGIRSVWLGMSAIRYSMAGITAWQETTKKQPQQRTNSKTIGLQNFRSRKMTDRLLTQLSQALTEISELCPDLESMFQPENETNVSSFVSKPASTEPVSDR